MPKANGADIEAAAISPPLPRFGSDRTNIFDLIKECAISPTEAGFGETAVVLQVKLGRPKSQEWVRCHPDPENVRYFNGVKDQKSNTLYFVTPRILSLFGIQVRPYRVKLAITTEQELYLWPAPTEGRMESDIAHLNAQQAALTKWIRIEWNGKTFNAVEPHADLGEPQWPDMPFNEILAMGLSNHLIDTEDHPFIKRLLGRL